MITEFHIKNFKSHADTLLSLKPLTFLTGLNGSGKTSIIQSLLLLRQSFKKQRLSEALILNDLLCNIGLGKDAIFQSSKDDYLQFGLKTDSLSYFWKFSTPENKDFLPLLQFNNDSNTNLNELQLFNNYFQYLMLYYLAK